MPRALVVLAAGDRADAAAALGRASRPAPRARGPPRRAGHALFVLSHVAITVVSYLAVIEDVTRGWLFINIWHNAQYLLFVWAMNARAASAAASTRAAVPLAPQPALAGPALCPDLPRRSRRRSTWRSPAPGRSRWPALPCRCMLVCHMAVNFHHYLIDAVIWRSPRRGPGLDGPRESRSRALACSRGMSRSPPRALLALLVSPVARTRSPAQPTPAAPPEPVHTAPEAITSRRP